ncbi:STM4014 family protein [Limibacter armeniacum]|uniref:STM4014 family protein n=1 Tax=Limibacter armeniacum TaxID=466084 RepID=UPI002FE5FB7B
MKIAILGNPENRRVQQFAQSFGEKEHCGVLSFLEVLEHPDRLPELLAGVDCLKIESSGENHEVFQQILAWGAEEEDRIVQNPISKAEALSLPFDMGLIQHSRQWYLGLQKFLRQIEKVAEQQHIHLLNTPRAILQMADKVQTHQLLEKNGIPKVPYLGVIENYEDLRNLISDTGFKRLFLKLAHASSASGVMAYQCKGEKELLISSATLVVENGKPKVYNSLKLKRYTNHQEIRILIDTLAKQYLLAERWVPKKEFEGDTFDLRLVYINQEVEHAVMRSSKQPMTNLHLGNKRGNLESLKLSLGTEKWCEIQEVVQKAVTVFDGAHVAGVDLLLTGKHYRPKVIEANAFGDLLPNIVNARGESTYQSQIRYLKNNAN